MSKFKIGDIGYIRMKVLETDAHGATVEVIDKDGRPWDNGPQWYATIHTVAKKMPAAPYAKEWKEAKESTARRPAKKSKKATNRKPGRPAKRIKKARR